MPHYTLKVEPSVVPTLLFTVELEFKPGLNRITLKLDGATMLSGKNLDVGNTVDAALLSGRLPTELYDVLASKYGEPVNRDLDCGYKSVSDPVPVRFAGCGLCGKLRGNRSNPSGCTENSFARLKLPFRANASQKRKHE
jgi:hypothetical protein